ncbi:MAG: signal peptidase II [Bacteroidetes bacterium]|nr:signal peptidase II [Bacteroidota bacterium]
MKNNITKYYLIATILIIIDQVTKITIKQLFDYGEVLPVISNIIQLTYIENTGIAFGIELGWAKIFASLMSIILGGLLVYYLYKIRKEVPFIAGIAITLIIAGAFGNGIDRCFYGVIYGTAPLFYGGVVDFILVDIPDINFWFLQYTHFPVFNIADSCVTCGVILLLFVHNKIPFFNNEIPKQVRNDN